MSIVTPRACIAQNRPLVMTLHFVQKYDGFVLVALELKR